MKDPCELICRVAEEAMIRHLIHTPRELGQMIGCGEKTAAKLLKSEEVRLTQEQIVNLFRLGGLLIWTN